jgi:DNA gyrase subunit A
MIQKGESAIEEKQEKINQQYKKDLKPEDLASLTSTILEIEPTQITGQFISEITNDEIMEHIQGPDFPTGGIIYDFKEIKEAYSKGKGKVVIRGKAEIVENKGNFEIVIAEIPYQVNKALMIEQIANLVKNGKIDGIRNIRDDSDRQGLQITIELKRSARPKVILNKLYKFSKLQTSYPMNMVALNSEGTPQLMNIKQILSEYVRHRQVIIVKRNQYDLVEARNRAHILEGLIIALNNLDEVIDTIRNSADSDVAREQLMKKFGLSEVQAVAILEMQLKRLAALERKKIEEEYESIKNLINQIVKLLTQPKEILAVIVKELKELIAVYGDKRLTRLIKGKIGEMSEEDLIPNAPTVIALTKENYIKRLADKTFRSQRRGGKGVKLTMKDEDAVETLITCENHDSLLFFTNLGRVFKLKAFEIPESSRTARGTAIVNLLSLKPEEKIQSILQLKDSKSEEQFIVLATKKGLVKKTAVNLFDNIRATGIIAISLNKDDELVKGQVTNGKHEIFLATRNGKCIRFGEKEIKASNRDTKGVRGITLKKDDYLVALESIDQTTKDNKEASILVITEKGMGKRTTLDQYPVQKRSGLGVKVADVTKKTGQVASIRLITEKHKGVVISTQQGQTIHLPNTRKSLPFLTRPTQGVILMKLDKGDEVATTALTEEME